MLICKFSLNWAGLSVGVKNITSTRFASSYTVSSEPANAKLNAYDLALVNPDLETIARNLTAIGSFQRFCLEVDYIISQTNQDLVEIGRTN